MTTLSAELVCVITAIIDTLPDQDTLSDDSISKLRSILPENVILAALDLIDRENVIKYTMPQGYPHYEVYGSTATYRVFLDMSISSIPFYCNCPAFTYAVLAANSHIMCKHVLATWLANKLSRFVERPVTQDDLESLMIRQYTNASP